ncbi:MAG: VacJ family lipoprotein [Campylobacteraceae bacterium]|jgi:phospholipid-binding lipoprotein MlaA|nr:VacJ family lipoprotein [Campylobacteraceae bacterium]
MKLLLFVALLLLLGGCASKNTSSQIAQAPQEIDEFEQEFSSSNSNNFDPLEGYNRVMTKFNDAAIVYVVSPVSQGYKKVVPKDARVSIGNFFSNLMFPVRFVNNLLQGKISGAFSEGGRFIINTTVGFLGFANVATDVYKIKEREEDFGQTLGAWGIPGGPHVVLPLLGPSNIRDFSGILVDKLVSPSSYFNEVVNNKQTLGLTSIEILNTLPQATDMYKTVTKDAIDLYPLLKNTYEQRRNALIKE